jgi:hypothetical protein
MTLSTSRNLTFLGIGTILAAVGAAVVQYANGGLAAVSWELLLGALVLGAGQIMAKGAQTTGGTVNATGVPVVDPSPPIPAKVP